MKTRGGSKAKQGRKRRDAKKTYAGIPEVIDVPIRLPTGDQVELRGVSTDLVADLRMQLRQRPELCHLTAFAFSHSARGLVDDEQQVISLHPLELEVVLEAYTHQSAIGHIRNLLEITAPTDMLGPRCALPEPGERVIKDKTATAPFGAATSRDSLEIRSDTKDFYGSFSLDCAENPLKSLKIVTRAAEDAVAGPFLEMEVALHDSQHLAVCAGPSGFYVPGKPDDCHHALVDLLKGVSDDFSERWDKLIATVSELYPLGNPPFGVISNAWLSPPCMASAPHRPSLLPAEDPELGAQNLGCFWGQKPSQEERDWLAEFSDGRRQLRVSDDSTATDVSRQLFLAHCSYTDTAIVEATRAITGGDSESWPLPVCRNGLEITVQPEPQVVLPDMNGALMDRELEQRSVTAILKGLASHDPVVAASTLDPVVVHHMGHIATASPSRSVASNTVPGPGDEPAAANCGNVPLKLNSMRWLLHEDAPPPARGSAAEAACLAAGAACLSEVLEACREALSQMRPSRPPLRSDLAVVWAQYHKEPPTEGPGAVPTPRTAANGRPKGPGAPMVLGKGSDAGEAALKSVLGKDTWAALKKLGIGIHRYSPTELTNCAAEWYFSLALRRVVWELRRLEVAPVDSLTLVDFMHSRGINMRHMGRVVQLSREAAAKDAALAMEQQAAADMQLRQQSATTASAGAMVRGPHGWAQQQQQQVGGAAQARPLAGRTPGSMAHITMVCQLDMVSRALKHLLRAVISTVRQNSESSGLDVAAAVAATLNAALGSSGAAHHGHLWMWLRSFVAKRYHHHMSEAECAALNRQNLFRSVCQKVGLEVQARSYDFTVTCPVLPGDLVATVPVVKAQPFSLSEPRQLLDKAKTAMDTGNLDEAATSATRAWLRLTQVAGAHHRLCSGAYSLLAVVLYHTGDFLQAAYYQQKALVINERALGLDHPDTLKAYGDLAVFYYSGLSLRASKICSPGASPALHCLINRLQHHQLALQYVLRCTYMLGLTCGSSHPNAAATFVNIAMMQEGLGDSNKAMRYLHAALKCNVALLGSEHVQTAASYHAMAIAVSLMEPPLYSLSVQHEQTCWEILERHLGAQDIRTQDAAAWLDYFDHKALDLAAAARKGSGAATGPSNEKYIAIKGHLPVKDLMAFLGEPLQGEVRCAPAEGGDSASNSDTPSSIVEFGDRSDAGEEDVSEGASEDSAAAAEDKPPDGVELAQHSLGSPVSVLSDAENDSGISDEALDGDWMVVTGSRSSIRAQSHRAEHSSDRRQRPERRHRAMTAGKGKPFRQQSKAPRGYQKVEQPSSAPPLAVTDRSTSEASGQRLPGPAAPPPNAVSVATREGGEPGCVPSSVPDVAPPALETPMQTAADAITSTANGLPDEPPASTTKPEASNSAALETSLHASDLPVPRFCHNEGLPPPPGPPIDGVLMGPPMPPAPHHHPHMYPYHLLPPGSALPPQNKSLNPTAPEFVPGMPPPMSPEFMRPMGWPMPPPPHHSMMMFPPMSIPPGVPPQPYPMPVMARPPPPPPFPPAMPLAHMMPPAIAVPPPLLAVPPPGPPGSAPPAIPPVAADNAKGRPPAEDANSGPHLLEMPQAGQLPTSRAAGGNAVQGVQSNLVVVTPPAGKFPLTSRLQTVASEAAAVTGPNGADRQTGASEDP